MRYRLHSITDYIKGAGLFMSASVLMLILNLLANPVIALNMSPYDYAITGYYTSFNGLISPLILFYLIGYYVKEYFKVSPDHREILYAETFKGLIYISGLIAVICFFVLLVYLCTIKKANRLPILPYLALSVFTIPLSGLLSLKLSRFRIEKQFKMGFIYSVTTGVFILVVTLLFVALFKWGAFGKLLAPFICNIVIFSWLLYTSRDIIKISIANTKYRQILKFCFPLVLGAMLEYFSSGYTTTYLESLGDMTTYGVYVVGVSIGAYITIFSSSISGVIQADVFEATVNQNWRRLILISLGEILVVGVIVGCFIFIAPYAIHLLTAGRYDDSTIYAQISSIAALSTTIFYRLNDFAIATNHQYFYFIATIIGSVIITVSLYYITRQYGFIGGCWVNALSNLSFGVILAILLIISNLRFYTSKKY